MKRAGHQRLKPRWLAWLRVAAEKKVISFTFTFTSTFTRIQSRNSNSRAEEGYLELLTVPDQKNASFSIWG